MKLSELVIGKKYAVVPSWSYGGAQSRDPLITKEGDVIESELLSLDKYEYEVSKRSHVQGDFKKAEAGNRSVGVLVGGLDGNGNTQYWTARLADIVALWSDLTPRWEEEKTEEARKYKEEVDRQKRIQDLRTRIDREVERVGASVRTTVGELLKKPQHVSIDTTGYGEEYRATVGLDLSDFELLVELAYEGKSALER